MPCRALSTHGSCACHPDDQKAGFGRAYSDHVIDRGSHAIFLAPLNFPQVFLNCRAGMCIVCAEETALAHDPAQTSPIGVASREFD
jgi:hypothetical protein